MIIENMSDEDIVKFLREKRGKELYESCDLDTMAIEDIFLHLHKRSDHWLIFFEPKITNNPDPQAKHNVSIHRWGAFLWQWGAMHFFLPVINAEIDARRKGLIKGPPSED